MLPAASGSREEPLESRRLTRCLVVALVLVVAPLFLLVTEVELSRWHRHIPFSTNPHATACAGDLTHAACIDSLLRLGDPQAGGHGDLYPEAIFQVDWSQHVTRADVLHHGALQRACTTHKGSVIPWDFGQSLDPNAVLLNRTDDHQRIVDTLRKCPSLDVYIPSGIRGQGYCEDAAAYTKYAHARMLPEWVLEESFYDHTMNRSVSYHELCPLTPLLVFNHYWVDVRDDDAWPTTKPLFLMPNIEMFELRAFHYWQADVVLCKTKICADYVGKWFAQEGNPRLTRVLYTRHTSSDIATNALMATAADSDWLDPRTTKNFDDPVFIHTAGSSTQKGTKHIFDCWLSRPDLPRVDVYMGEDLYGRLFAEKYDRRIERAKNLRLHTRSLDSVSFGSMIAGSTFFLCPSRMEGYGHYINHARASGGLVLTPNVPPMNELITPDSGVLIEAVRDSWARHFLGGTSHHSLGLRNVTGFVSRFGSDEVCAAVDKVITQLGPVQRKKLAHRARQQFLYDTAFFSMKMQTLRLALRPAEHALPDFDE